MKSAPEYVVMTRAEAARRQSPPRLSDKVDWRPVVEALILRQALFFPGDSLSDTQLKYLQLALTRRGYPGLVMYRVMHNGVAGRQLQLGA